MTADTYIDPRTPFIETFGIFSLDGLPVITADSVISMEFRKESLVSDYPLEGGRFETYNKVAIPFDVRFRFSAGGNEAKRAALLASVEALADDTALYNAVSPEAQYLNCNVVHHDYRRTSINGVGLLVVDVWLREVRTGGQTGTAIRHALLPWGNDRITTGSVQTILLTIPSIPQFA